MEFEKANEKIKNIRKALGLSQTEFGKIVGKKQTTIADWENNKITLNLDAINCFLDNISNYFENLFNNKKTRDEIINNKNFKIKIRKAYNLYRIFLYEFIETFNKFYGVNFNDKEYIQSAVDNFNNKPTKKENNDIEDYFKFMNFLLADDDNNN